jgi:hypothetical protein
MDRLLSAGSILEMRSHGNPNGVSVSLARSLHHVINLAGGLQQGHEVKKVKLG